MPDEIVMETVVPRSGPVTYRVKQNGRIVWQRSLTIRRGRGRYRDDYRTRQRAAWEQEQVCRTLIDTGVVPVQFENEISS